MGEGKRKFSGFQLFFNTFLFILTAISGFVFLQQTTFLSQHKQEVLGIATAAIIPTATPTLLPTATPTPSPTPSPIPTATPTPRPTADPTDDSVWDRLAQCESNGNWAENTGNGYYGGLQFNQTAWESVGGSGNPAQASQTEQISRGKMLQAQRGWSPWRACGKELGLY